ncbi:MAG: phage portal protein, partial [Opitutae bacterium]|nr:phage portal protein [Opitutae bacterium]
MRRSRISLPAPDALDKFIGWLSPEAGARRLKAKAAMAMYGGYTGARSDRRQTKAWHTLDGGADQVTLPDLPILRERSHDLVRNAPLATGAINTVVTNVVGTGLKVQSRIDREVLAPYLGNSEEAFDAFERGAEREFRFWANSRNCDATRMQDFAAQQDLALRSTLVAGDVFVLRRHVNRPGARYSTALQLVEAERVCNPNFNRDLPSLSGGVEKDEFGAAVAYHVLQAHPGDVTNPASRQWVRLRAQDRQGLWLVNHLARPTRVGMTRPAPYLAPVIESLKQLDKYSEAEL